MVTDEYRKANELADLLDFELDSIEGAKRMGLKHDRENAAVARLRADLAEQERIDGKPADLKEKRRGFAGAI
ncbi:MAG: hypothetical protein ACO3JG_12015 [Luteolibacter sp.]